MPAKLQSAGPSLTPPLLPNRTWDVNLIRLLSIRAIVTGQPGQKGKKVDSLTLKAMIEVSLLAVRDAPYLFCRTAECPAVYFSADGTQSFTKEQIRVPVYQKEPNDESVLVCYCFYHSPATIRAELLATGTSTVVEAIARGIQADQCACGIRNPQGSCCLGNVQATLEWIRHELGTDERDKITQNRHVSLR